jgi:hypothetical protein
MRDRHAGRQPRNFDESFLPQTGRVLTEDLDLMRRALDQQQRGNFVWTQHSILHASDEQNHMLENEAGNSATVVFPRVTRLQL